MALALYLVLLGIACVIALRNWRRGWMLLPLFAILQDPVRKLTPDTPVVISFSIMAIYLTVMIAARGTLIAHFRELTRRFPAVTTAGLVLGLFILLAAINGLFTFGIGAWSLPVLSLALYSAPLPAVVVGYAFLQREEDLYKYLRMYALVTSVAMVGTLLEYARVRLAVLGTVALPYDYIRHLPGIQIRLLSGFYRAPDIMAWHASMLTATALVMAMKRGSRRLIWIGVTGWGFLNCIMSGRRKAVYFVIAFVLAMVFLASLVVVILVVQNIASGEATNVYAKGATASRTEIFQRLEGGTIETFRQFGLLGAGLGAATQGTWHLTGNTQSLGWQEGGLGKLAVELGLPGLLAAVLFAAVLFRMLLRLTSIGDVPGSSQFARVALFAFVTANVVNFLGSAQAYSDGMLALSTAFLSGCLLATAALDERLTAAETARSAAAMQPAPA
jgi:hypothetical protein